MKPAIGLSDEQRAGVISVLNVLLSDEYLLYTKARNYHWNVLGPQFNDLHKFFEGHYEQLEEVVDEVAERARSLGGFAFGTMVEFAQHTRLREHPEDHPDAKHMLANLLADHESLIRDLRNDAEICDEKFNDMGTNDFLTGLMERHEKMAWMFRSFLEGEHV